MPDFETLGKRAERELAAERDEELERLLYEDEQKLAGESAKMKRLRREIEAESLARMERLAKTEDDFREVTRQWDRREENGDRRFRYHETVRGDVPLEYGMAKSSSVFPANLNSPYWKAVRRGDYLELIFDCPFEIEQVTSDPFVSSVLGDLKDEYRELLCFLCVRKYSTEHLGKILGQTDRNIRKKLSRLLARLRKKLFRRLAEHRSSGGTLTKRQREFMDAYRTGHFKEEEEREDETPD